jgi:hypothetical protein
MLCAFLGLELQVRTTPAVFRQLVTRPSPCDKPTQSTHNHNQDATLCHHDDECDITRLVPQDLGWPSQ